MEQHHRDLKRDRLERMWRLATLLTPDEATARAVLARALRSPTGLERTPPARLDRLIVLRAREASGARRRAPARRSALERLRSQHRRQAHRPAMLEDRDDPAPVGAASGQRRRDGDDPGEALRRALSGLPFQAREAWTLHDFQGRGLVETSRAMDCSRTAVQRHLERARQTLGESMGDSLAPGAAALRQRLDRLDASWITERVEAAERRRRRAWLVAALLGLAAVAAGALAIWRASG